MLESDHQEVFYLKALEVLPANAPRRQLQGPQIHVCAPRVLQRSPVVGPARGHPTAALEVRAPCQHDCPSRGPTGMSSLLSVSRVRSPGPAQSSADCPERDRLVLIWPGSGTESPTTMEAPRVLGKHGRLVTLLPADLGGLVVLPGPLPSSGL